MLPSVPKLRDAIIEVGEGGIVAALSHLRSPLRINRRLAEVPAIAIGEARGRSGAAQHQSPLVGRCVARRGSRLPRARAVCARGGEVLPYECCMYSESSTRGARISRVLCQHWGAFSTCNCKRGISLEAVCSERASVCVGLIGSQLNHRRQHPCRP